MMRLSAALMWVWVSFLLSTATAAEPHRVALSDFSTDENEWDSITAAVDASRLVQAELSGEKSFHWLEREELGLAQKEIETRLALERDVRETVRTARWKKADWLITGRFIRNGNTRELILEVIDLAHADVLASKKVPLGVSSQQPLREALASPRLMVQGLRGALHEAERRELEVAGRPVLAVLIFPNSEIFERSFHAALAEASVAGAPLRVLRVPRAGESLGEAELVLGGFAEDPEGKWRSIADVYVWGSLVVRETGAIDGQTITDAHTPAISLTVWDGQLSPFQFVEEGEPVARRDFDAGVAAQARQLARSVAEVVRRRSSGPMDESQRERISRSLLRSAEETMARREHEEGYSFTPKGRRSFFNITQTLEVACFFDPWNRTAQETFIRFRWDSRLERDMKSRFGFHLGRSVAWGRFVDHFGFPEGPDIQEQIRAAMKQQPIDHEKVRALMKKTGTQGRPIAPEFFNSAIVAVESAKLGNAEEFGFPRGVPKDAAASWIDNLTREVARRTLLAAGQKDVNLRAGLTAVFAALSANQFYLRDPAERVEFLKKVWPYVVSQPLDEDLRKRIQWTFAELGKPLEAGKFLDAIPNLVAAPVRAVPTLPHSVKPRAARFPPSLEDASQLFSIPAVAALPREVKPVVEKLALQAADGFVFSVQKLVLAGGKIWLIGRGIEQTEVEGPNKALSAELRPAQSESTRLFTFDPATAGFARVSAAQQFTPGDLLAHAGRIWVTFGKDGVATLDPASGTLRRFGRDDGLEVTSAYFLTAVEGRVFLTANLGRYFEWEAAANRWQICAGPPRLTGRALYAGEIQRLGGTGPWLLLWDGAIRLCDTRTHDWNVVDKDLASKLDQAFRETPTCVEGDATGFWIGDSDGLHFLSPRGEVIHHTRPRYPFLPGRPQKTAEVVGALLKRRAAPRPPSDPPSSQAHPLQPTSRIPGVVSALANDGDFLWVAASQAGSLYGWSHVMLFHKPSGRWVAQFPADRTACLAVDDKYLWLGCAFGYGPRKNCLQRIEKRAFYEIPAEQWMPASVSDAEASAPFERLDPRGKAIWHFTGGDYAKAAELLASIQPTTPEILFLQGLCFDGRGLNEPEKSRSFFQRIIDLHPTDGLAEEARKQIRTLGTAER